MNRISKVIVKYYKSILVIFSLFFVICALLSLGVSINYSIKSYLPDDAESVKSLNFMKKEFNEPLPNLRIMIKDKDIVQVLDYKEKLEKIDGVKLIIWLDLFENTSIPVNFINDNLKDSYYKKRNALLEVAVETQNSKKVLDNIKNIMPNDTSYEGSLVEESAAQNAVSREIIKISLFAVPLAFLILFIYTKSIFESIIILGSIGVAIILNMGTNIFLGEISFVTQSVSAILQLAVSMDYAIFLIHEFKHQRNLCSEDLIALEKAITISSSAIVSSAMTTVFGFLVLIFMKFKLGEDLGIVLAKGTMFSLISVIFFLPSLIRISIKYINKNKRLDIFPDFKFLSKILLKYKKIVVVLVFIIPIVFIGQLKNEFIYGMGEYQKDSIESKDQKSIIDLFGKDIKMAIIVPRENMVKENDLIRELKQINHIKSIQSYTENVGIKIPDKVLSKDLTKQILSSKYSRLVLNVNTEREGETAFNLVNEIKNTVRKYYKNFHLVGESVIMENLSKIIQKDNIIVNIFAILSIGIIIMINFKSLIIPFILVLTIETSIWINLAIPYFTSTKLSFIGYLVISSIQLGATVDYAILYTSNYLKFRKTLSKKDALINSGAKVYKSLIVPALILICSGVILYLVSSIFIVSELGLILARGAFLSLLLVVVVLPLLLYIFDEVIEKTTYKSNFRKDNL